MRGGDGALQNLRQLLRGKARRAALRPLGPAGGDQPRAGGVPHAERSGEAERRGVVAV